MTNQSGAGYLRESVVNNLKLLRLRTVAEKLGVNRCTVYDMIANGTMTKPVRLGPKISAWPEHEVDAIIATWIGGGEGDDRAIRELVCSLMRKRACYEHPDDAACESRVSR